MRKYLRSKAFTLAEILIVVVIIGILAGMALPNYARTIERSHLRDAEANLMAIHAANRIFFAENGTYWPPGMANLNAINTNLRLFIVANGFSYACFFTGPLQYLCIAGRDGGAYQVRVTQVPINPGVNPICVPAAGPCP